MTKEEFISRLKENKKNFKSVEELIEYQLPVLQHYLENYQGNYILDNSQLGGKIVEVDFSKITITPSGSTISVDFMRRAFKSLTLRVEEFEHDRL